MKLYPQMAGALLRLGYLNTYTEDYNSAFSNYEGSFNLYYNANNTAGSISALLGLAEMFYRAAQSKNLSLAAQTSNYLQNSVRILGFFMNLMPTHSLQPQQYQIYQQIMDGTQCYLDEKSFNQYLNEGKHLEASTVFKCLNCDL